jgi:hypothetical protein
VKHHLPRLLQQTYETNVSTPIGIIGHEMSSNEVLLQISEPSSNEGDSRSFIIPVADVERIQKRLHPLQL